MKIRVIFIVLAIFISCFYVSLVIADNNVMTVEANIIKSELNISNESIVSVQVPDYLFFGDVNIGETTNKVKIVINNTGNTDITVTPLLQNSSEEIFSYLYLGTSTCTNSCQRIGNYSINIAKPSASVGLRNATFYMKLDLTNYPDEISKDMPNHQTEINFVAMAQ